MNITRSILTALFSGLLLFRAGDATAQSSKENADFKLAIDLYNDGLFDLAAEQLNQFVTNFPNTANGIQARFYLGLTEMRLKRYDDARLTFQSFALTYQDDPKAPEAWLNVGECYAALKSYKEAALAYERAHVFHPKSKVAPEALIRASKYFKLAGQTEDARRVLRIALQEYANSSSALSARTSLAQMYFEEGNLVQAQNELKRVIESDPSGEAKAQALLVLGNIYLTMGDAEQARSNYQDIVTKYKTSAAAAGAYLGLAKVQSRSGNFAEAIDDFKKGLGDKAHVDSGLVYEAGTAIAGAYASRGDAANALTYFDKAAGYASTPEQSQATLWSIASVAAQGKNYRRSDNACNQLLKSDVPDSVRRRASIRLALNAEGRKDYAQAVQYFTTFLDQHAADPSSDAVAFHVADLLENKMHDERKAVTSYEQFITRYTHSPYIDDAYAGAARSYGKLGEFTRALEVYNELLKRYPASEYNRTVKDSIRIIQTFEAKNQDAGVEKLALLLGDFVSDKDKTGLPFRLGEIYFHDLKNYAAAAAQFSNAINSGVSDDRFVDALFFRARSLEYLSWTDSTYVPKSIEAYQTYLKSYPHDKHSTDAELSYFMLSAWGIQEAQAARAQVLASNPVFPRQDLLLQRIGLLEEQADSTQAALTTYGMIAAEYKNSPVMDEIAYRQIVLLSRAGLTDSAMHESEAYLETYPESPHCAEVTASLGDLLVTKGDDNRAAECYRQLCDRFGYTSFGVSARIKLADACVSTGKYNDAISMYSDLLAEQSNNPLTDQDSDPGLLFALGRAYDLAGNSVLAKKYLVQVITSDRSGDLRGAAYNLLGLMAKNEGNLDLATSYFREAARVTPAASTSREVADLLFDNGAYSDAIRQYTLLSQKAESDTARQFYDARVIIAHYRNGQAPEAEKEAAIFLKRYKDAENDAAAFELEKGLSYYRSEDYAAAQKSFDRVTTQYDETPSAPWAMYWTGKTLEATKRQPDALKRYEALMKAYPSSPVIPRVYLALGNIYYNLEKWDESIRNYKLIVDDPQADKALLPLAMSNLIETYDAAGVYDAALQLTRKYLEQYPNAEDSFDKKIKIGILLQELGYNDQAVLQLQSLLDQAGSDLEGEIRYYIGEANYNKGDYQQAILDFLKVPYLVTKKGKLDWTANSLYMAGQSYEKLGRYDQALTMYQQITERPGIDETFKAAAKKEIDRVKLVVTKPQGR